MSQYSVPPAVTGPFGNLCTSSSEIPESLTRPAITRPPDAPRSTAATATGPRRPGRPAFGAAVIAGTATATGPVGRSSGRWSSQEGGQTPASTGTSRPVVSGRSPAQSATTAAATCSPADTARPRVTPLAVPILLGREVLAQRDLDGERGEQDDAEEGRRNEQHRGVRRGDEQQDRARREGITKPQRADPLPVVRQPPAPERADHA